VGEIDGKIRIKGKGGVRAISVPWFQVTAVIAVLAWGGSLRRHPYTPCHRCNGSGPSEGSTRQLGRSPACGGTGRRLRRGGKETRREAVNGQSQLMG
jgi:hypothetical protein